MTLSRYEPLPIGNKHFSSSKSSKRTISSRRRRNRATIFSSRSRRRSSRRTINNSNLLISSNLMISFKMLVPGIILDSWVTALRISCSAAVLGILHAHGDHKLIPLLQNLSHQIVNCVEI
ncbi:hypothetical protein PVAP13_J010410 [Panicum virgatum]|nr:hypothetical protein PVAP13_J010410 [Panicum virgatum]